MWDALVALLWQLIRSVFAAGGISPVDFPPWRHLQPHPHSTCSKTC